MIGFVFVLIFGSLATIFCYFFGATIFFYSLIFGLLIYHFRPHYFPCKGWKRFAVCYVILCLITANFFIFSEWLHEEKISSLFRAEGILNYRLVYKGAHQYYILDKITQRKYDMDFFLCDIDPEKYESQSIIVWYNVKNYVYQMQIGDEMIVSLEDANKNVGHRNYFSIESWFPIFLLITAFCLSRLYELNNHYKKVT